MTLRRLWEDLYLCRPAPTPIIKMTETAFTSLRDARPRVADIRRDRTDTCWLIRPLSLDAAETAIVVFIDQEGNEI